MSITVTSPISAADLVAALVGDRIAAVRDEIYIGATIAAGTFAGGTAAGFPFDAGIALTTGAAPLTAMEVSGNNPNHCPNVGLPGPNDCVNAGRKNNVAGSAPLAALINASVGQSFDASILSFSFIPLGNTITLQYIFASEEYLEFVGSKFNDVCAIFLNGTAPSNNIALVPGTSTAVSINNVNQSKNSQYFNFGGIDCQYDGYVGIATEIFATGSVIPGAWNTLWIGVTDLADSFYDSGLMLKAHSLTVTGGNNPDGCISNLSLGAAATPQGCFPPIPPD